MSLEKEPNVADLRCVACSEEALELDAGSVKCRSCGASFDVVGGVPFIGHYEQGDLLGLIEIAAVFDIGTGGVSWEEFNRIEDLCADYSASGEDQSFLENSEDPFASAYWFQNRYSEWKEFSHASSGVEFDGKEVLDVGAGSGFDSMRLVKRGATVTALEYHPGLAISGSKTVPEIRWIGGFSHLLPFQNDTFDVITVNAALHHMRDIRAAIREMLRVLKPGGTFISSGDPFRRKDSTVEDELVVFDDHPAVLAGVNEGLVRIDLLLEEFLSHKDAFKDISAVTHSLVGAKSTAAAEVLGEGYLRWHSEDLTALMECSGSISVTANLGSSINYEASTQEEIVIRVGEYFGMLGDYRKALGSIKDLIPASWVNLPVVGARQSWFELLNGWKAPRQGEKFRIGFGRARWFLREGRTVTGIEFFIRSFAEKGDSREFEVKVNGVVEESFELTGEGSKPHWRKFLDRIFRRLASRRLTSHPGKLGLSMNKNWGGKGRRVTVKFPKPVTGTFVVEIHQKGAGELLRDFGVRNRRVFTDE